VEFGLFGPLEVLDGGRPVAIQSAKHRILLAALLLRAGELVTVDELADAVWGDALPASPRRAIQTYVSRLRQLLHAEELVQSRPEGYVLGVARSDVDVGRFELLLERAREAAGTGGRNAEAEALRQALGLWRGKPLADVTSEPLHRHAVARLAEQRLDALQRRIEAELALGRDAELVSELRALTDQFPLREQLWGQLMTALYRCGRQADSLDAYRRVSGLLADDLGVDPGPELRALHQAILTNDPTLAAPPPTGGLGAWATPSQLPLDVTDFVGRADLVNQIRHQLADDRGVPIVAVSGSPGVGKTALAIHAAHGLTERFPDGQLYVNLHGSTAGLGPLAPLEVLGRVPAVARHPGRRHPRHAGGGQRRVPLPGGRPAPAGGARQRRGCRPGRPVAAGQPGLWGAGDQPRGPLGPGRRQAPAPGRPTSRRGPDRLRWGFDVLLNGILQTLRPEPGTTPGA